MPSIGQPLSTVEVPELSGTIGPGNHQATVVDVYAKKLGTDPTKLPVIEFIFHIVGTADTLQWKGTGWLNDETPEGFTRSGLESTLIWFKNIGVDTDEQLFYDDENLRTDGFMPVNFAEMAVGRRVTINLKVNNKGYLNVKGVYPPKLSEEELEEMASNPFPE